MLANKQCIMIEEHWFNNSKIFSLLKNLEDTKLRIFFHNPDLLVGAWYLGQVWDTTVSLEKEVSAQANVDTVLYLHELKTKGSTYG